MHNFAIVILLKTEHLQEFSISTWHTSFFLANEKKQPPTIWRPTWHFWEVGKFYPFDAHICARGNNLASWSLAAPRLTILVGQLTIAIVIQ